MKCKNCNGTLRATSLFCPNCGAKVVKEEVKEKEVKVEEPKKEEKKQEPPKETVITTTSNDEGNIGWGFLGFFIPIAGIILFFVWLNDKPKSSKAAGLGALIRIILSAIIILFFISFFISTIRNSTYYPYGNYGNYNYYNDYNYDYDYDDYYDWD